MTFIHTVRARKLLYFAIITLITAIVFFLFWFRDNKKILITQDWKIQGLTTYSQDGYISVKWDMINASNLDSIQIEVKDDNDELLILKECSFDTNLYEFSEGTHGIAYNFRVNLVLSDGQIISSDRLRSVFLDYSCLADVPFLNINTINNKELDCKPVYSPAGCWGVGLADNEYRNATMSISSDNDEIFAGDIEIRVRGNTSALDGKKPYKIKTSTAVNLLDLENTKYANQEWYLLPVYDFKFLVGTETANLCGMEWQPRYRIANVMLNGDYLGCYWITESVSVGQYRCDVSNSGYLIECDAYWWNSNDEYFKIDNQMYATGYTFKYPSFNLLDVNKIKNHLNDGINYLRNNDARYMQYIDVDTWASWLLTHDILGTWDSGGSNLFYYKEDFKQSNPLSTKIKMGPAWDFNSIFLMTNDWSRIRSDEHGYFPLLICQEDFKKSYNENWERLSDTLVDSIDEKIDAFFKQNPVGIEQSLYLDSVRWRTNTRNIEKEKEKIHNWFVSRTEWLNNNIK